MNDAAGLRGAFCAAALFLGACAERPEAADAGTGASVKAPDNFVNIVGTVSESPSVAAGTLYVFLSEGTLVIASPHGKPALGSWKYERGTFEIAEEGIAYAVEVLASSPGEFGVRIHNPGEPTEITFVPAGPRVPLN